MKYNKQKAFTLAEILVLLLTLSILLAAFAPVFTKRYTSASNSVWRFVPGDEEQDIYFDVSNRSNAAQAFMGLSPLDGAEVPLFLNYNDSDDLTEVEPVYSKLVIHASDNLQGAGNKPQHQIQFRYITKGNNTSDTGDLVASLFAGDGNMMLGGPFKDLKKDAKNNTVFGYKAAGYNYTTGYANTVYGAAAGYRMTKGYSNTLVGNSAGEFIRAQNANTIVGTYSGQRMFYNNNTSTDNFYNTLLGGYIDTQFITGSRIESGYNTVVGLGALSGCTKKEANTEGVYSCTSSNTNTGGYNTAVGNLSLPFAGGAGNTALGYNALGNLKDGNYNTAIGANSCAFLGKDEEGKALNKVTCIGADSGPVLDGMSTDGLSDDAGHVFIGGMPKDYKLNYYKTAPRAVLEVHNTDIEVKVDDSLSGIGNLPSPSGHESVVINGNLIVRGQTYLEAQMIRPYIGYRNALRTPKGLTLFKLFPANFHIVNSGVEVFSGFDGIDRAERTLRTCRGHNKGRKFDAGAPNCICTVVGDSKTDVGGSYHDGFSTTFSKKVDASIVYDAKPSYSYDWYTTANLPSSYFNSYNMNSKNVYYIDQATGNFVFLAEHSDGFSGSGTNLVDNYVDISYSHGNNPYTDAGILPSYACCPNLISDIRLKNVGDKFVAGLDEIRKINVYNYTFKTDKNNAPQVGVIAQDLKRVFPNAVSKDEKGYYQIRWDEMLYAAINAIKTLNTKIEKLADRIATDKERIANLKADNAKMYAQLDKLANELAELEAKKRK